MAAGVVALVLVTSLSTIQAGFANLHGARSATLAGQILQCELERLRLKDWTTVSAYAASSTLALSGQFASDPSTAGKFTLTRSVDTVRTDLRKISYSVSWRTLDGRTLSRSLMTYYGRNGMSDSYYNSL